jgi:MraZ protein
MGLSKNGSPTHRAYVSGFDSILEHLFSSSALCTVDDGGCVSLPPFVRNTLERRADSPAVVIGLHETEPCLRAYDSGYVRILHADHERCRSAETAEAHHVRARRTFGFTEEASYGPDGKITLPPLMRRKGKIEDLALFVGTGGTFEIWNPQLALEAGDVSLRELTIWRLEEFSPPAN